MSFPAPSDKPLSIGERFLEELLWVHGVLRQDLETVRALADRVLAGATPEEINAEVAALQVNSPLWKLRVTCLYYCRFVHGHHSLEDRAFFPALRASNPALAPIVDKLEADHRLIATYLAEVEASARAVVNDDGPESRERIVAALRSLSDHLLAHLAYEEESVAPTLRTWDSWPLA